MTAKRDVKLTQQVVGWTGSNGKDVAGKDITADTAKTVGATVEVSVGSDGTVSIKDKT